ncbi:MAG: GNAT family N-acetyltransferase [Candidatus Hodarchaeota archaeon]
MTKPIRLTDNVEIKIRTGMIRDADRLNEIEKACFPSELRYGPSILTTLLSMTPIYTVLTVHMADDSEILAFAIGEQDDFNETVGRIITIQVDPPFWRMGIGKKLLLELETKLYEEYSIKSFELQVHYKNKRAIRFYQKNGYKIVRLLQNYYERKEHAYLMEKSSP